MGSDGERVGFHVCPSTVGSADGLFVSPLFVGMDVEGSGVGFAVGFAVGRDVGLLVWIKCDEERTKYG